MTREETIGAFESVSRLDESRRDAAPDYLCDRAECAQWGRCVWNCDKGGKSYVGTTEGVADG